MPRKGQTIARELTCACGKTFRYIKSFKKHTAVCEAHSTDAQQQISQLREMVLALQARVTGLETQLAQLQPPQGKRGPTDPGRIATTLGAGRRTTSSAA